MYTQTSDTKVEALNFFLNELGLPHIGKIQNDLIIADFTLEEINNSIGSLKSSKTPSSDGFPACSIKPLKWK